MKTRRPFLILVLYSLLCISTGTLWLSSGYIRIMVSDSMAPAFRSGDCVVLLPSIKPLLVGTVIGFQVSDQFVIHRIISISERGITTQGDQNKAPDPWLIPYSAILGIPILRIPFIGYIFLLKLPQTLKTWLVISPLLALLLFAVRAAFFGTEKQLKRLAQGRG